MKALPVFLLVSALFAFANLGASAARADSEQPSLSIVISVPQASARLGEDMKVEVSLTNISDHDILYDANGHELPFGLEVRDGMDRTVSRTPQGLRALAFEGRVFAVPLHPGESIHRERLLNKDIKLDKAGTYKVQAIRMTNKTSAVKSNIVQITILP